MPAEILVAFATGVVTAMITSNNAISKSIRLQQDILKRGVIAQGRVLRVRQFPMLDALAKVHFEFQPEGSQSVVRACHVDRRSGELRASRPAAGSFVTVHYLPENPTQAVIGKLVPRFVNPR